jgi:hypothetical protein
MRFEQVYKRSVKTTAFSMAYSVFCLLQVVYRFDLRGNQSRGADERMKLSLYLIKDYVMTAYGEVAIQFYAFLVLYSMDKRDQLRTPVG